MHLVQCSSVQHVVPNRRIICPSCVAKGSSGAQLHHQQQPHAQAPTLPLQLPAAFITTAAPAQTVSVAVPSSTAVAGAGTGAPVPGSMFVAAGFGAGSTPDARKGVKRPLGTGAPSPGG